VRRFVQEKRMLVGVGIFNEDLTLGYRAMCCEVKTSAYLSKVEPFVGLYLQFLVNKRIGF